MQIKKLFIALGIVLPLHMQGQNFLIKDAPEVIESYVNQFNREDNELYKQDIPNCGASDFLRKNIPFFECPDKELEKTYYFRWWTYRKHIKKTPDGFVITEFLPDVPWAGKYNTISCAANHHFYEGRWLRNAEILSDYASFWFSGSGSPRLYSFGAADAIYNYYLIHNDKMLLADLYPKLKDNFAKWEEEKRDSTGMFWQVDDRDGMEMSVSGHLSEGGRGYRPTINSYMYGEAVALAKIASIVDRDMEARTYQKKADKLKGIINRRLWDKRADFYKVIPLNGKMEFSYARELLGYIPWFYNIPPDNYSIAWKQLFDSKGFEAAYGPTTVEQRCPDFKISYEGHECQWNGPSWPYLTSMTLAAMANYFNSYDSPIITKKDYLSLLNIYSNSHRILSVNNDTICWIDENINPYTGDWISRTRLKSWKNGTWDDSKGGVEKEGKIITTLLFCNLIISGLMGVRPQEDGSIIINPLVPDGCWDYFCLGITVYCQGKTITIIFDKKGKKYGRGKGFIVYVDDKCLSHTTRVPESSNPVIYLCNIQDTLGDHISAFTKYPHTFRLTVTKDEGIL